MHSDQFQFIGNIKKTGNKFSLLIHFNTEWRAKKGVLLWTASATGWVLIILHTDLTNLVFARKRLSVGRGSLVNHAFSAWYRQQLGETSILFMHSQTGWDKPCSAATSPTAVMTEEDGFWADGRKRTTVGLCLLKQSPPPPCVFCVVEGNLTPYCLNCPWQPGCGAW